MNKFIKAVKNLGRHKVRIYNWTVAW
jgi:hypothetical protein